MTIGASKRQRYAPHRFESYGGASRPTSRDRAGSQRGSGAKSCVSKASLMSCGPCGTLIFTAAELSAPSAEFAKSMGPVAAAPESKRANWYPMGATMSCRSVIGQRDPLKKSRRGRGSAFAGCRPVPADVSIRPTDQKTRGSCRIVTRTSYHQPKGARSENAPRADAAWGAFREKSTATDQATGRRLIPSR